MDDGERASEGGISSTLVPSLPPNFLLGLTADHGRTNCEAAWKTCGPPDATEGSGGEAGARGGQEISGFKRGGSDPGDTPPPPPTGDCLGDHPPTPASCRDKLRIAAGWAMKLAGGRVLPPRRRG
ncbi:hypothetical protein NDU88_004919 [Pleurodeles waltl]|uniref:Uncharacterized protein n=1 Tax=Pleurodeles waltl TaxID=8319 RepID=A0AAV7SK67_PLEWA|nr:hypothetical protein NDU88_004919 [Pleurodeles waltl]